jgi:hypothetical protein
MRIMLAVLCLLTVAPVIENQHGFQRLAAFAMFVLLIWAAGKEEKRAEQLEERRHEEIVELLREIKLNQMP